MLVNFNDDFNIHDWSSQWSHNLHLSEEPWANTYHPSLTSLLWNHTHRGRPWETQQSFGPIRWAAPSLYQRCSTFGRTLAAVTRRRKAGRRPTPFQCKSTRPIPCSCWTGRKSQCLRRWYKYRRLCDQSPRRRCFCRPLIGRSHKLAGKSGNRWSQIEQYHTASTMWKDPRSTESIRSQFYTALDCS